MGTPDRFTRLYDGTAQPATPGQIHDVLYGLPPQLQDEEVVYDESDPISPTPNYRNLGQGKTSRRTIRLHDPHQEGRSPRSRGNFHAGGFQGRR
jgi:hypothetical protein